MFKKAIQKLIACTVLTFKAVIANYKQHANNKTFFTCKNVTMGEERNYSPLIVRDKQNNIIKKLGLKNLFLDTQVFQQMRLSILLFSCTSMLYTNQLFFTV